MRRICALLLFSISASETVGSDQQNLTKSNTPNTNAPSPQADKDPAALQSPDKPKPAIQPIKESYSLLGLCLLPVFFGSGYLLTRAPIGINVLSQVFTSTGICLAALYTLKHTLRFDLSRIAHDIDSKNSKSTAPTAALTFKLFIVLTAFAAFMHLFYRAEFRPWTIFKRFPEIFIHDSAQVLWQLVLITQ